MIALALDVGHSTGFVIADVAFRQNPKILFSATYGLQALFDPEFFSISAKEIEPWPLDVIILELPATDRFSSDASMTLSTRVAWNEWATRYREIYPGTRLKQITPATWKTTPAMQVDVFIGQIPFATKWASYHPTRHESDASKILFWFARYGYDT